MAFSYGDFGGPGSFGDFGVAAPGAYGGDFNNFVPNQSSSGGFDLGKILGGVGTKVGEGLGGLAAGQIGKAFGNLPTSYGAGVAQEQVDKSISQIKDLINELKNQTMAYRVLGDQELSKLGGISGIQLPEYRVSSIDQFNKGVQRERDYGTGYLKDYDPNILTSPSAGRFNQAIGSASSQYANALKGLGERGSQRMFEAAVAPIPAFKQIANDKDFNNLLNPEFMNLASNPMTVNMDKDRYKPYMQYNV